MCIAYDMQEKGFATKEERKESGPTEIRTRIAGFRVPSDNHYTIRPGFKATLLWYMFNTGFSE